MMSVDNTLFGREWLRSPLKIGAIAPSSTALARAITKGLSAENAPVIELGPGSGVFTSAILSCGIPLQRLATIEANQSFASALAVFHTEMIVIHGDAARVRHLNPFAPEASGAVICGLPLLSMPSAKVLRILKGSFRALRPGGAFRLFTYGARCPVPARTLERLDLVARRTAFVALNIPPASVYVIEKKE